jgi:hypothetical protein
MWLDADHTNGIQYRSMKFTSRAFGEKVEDTVNNGASCNSMTFGDNQLDSELPGNNVSKRRRQETTRHPWMEQALVVSQNITTHRAKDLCDSETSYGPDFIGSDGYFCDMGAHKLTPLCSTENVDGCIDVDHAAKSITKRTTVARREVQLAHKTYTKVATW